MERRQTPHPLQETTISAVIKCNCPRLVIGFGLVSVHVNGPVWQLAYNDQNEALLSCEKHTCTCSLLCDCDQWKDKLAPGKQHLSYMCAFCVCLQSYWLPNIPRVIRPVSGMRGKVIKKGKLVPVHAVKACRGNRGTALSTRNLSTRWR